MFKSSHDLIALLRQLSQDSWLLGLDNQHLAAQAEAQFHALIQSYRDNQPPIVLLAASDPAEFLASFMAACAANCPTFLGNPHWSTPEWQQVCDQVQPRIILGEPVGELARENRQDTGQKPQAKEKIKAPIPGQIMIPTGGSSGQVRFAIHTWQTLTASVRGFQQYFEADVINSCCTLPLYHVSGLMQLMRSLLTGGKLAIVPFKQLDFQRPEFDPADFFISLVPTQLQRLLQNPEAIVWLSQFRTVLLGGAPAWDDLLAIARQNKIRLAPTYGMTETASQVATLKPHDFLAGKLGCGQALPHAKIWIVDPQSRPVETGHLGAIVIQSAAMAAGYYGKSGNEAQEFQAQGFQTDDLGYLDTEGYLHIVGRASRKIITGGENVFPDEVEAVIRATGLVADVCVVGLPDRHWGEVVTAVYVSGAASDASGSFAPNSSPPYLSQLQQAIAPSLSKFKQPKRWIAVEKLPRNPQGKINYDWLRALGD
ncbi:MAG TPA: 2-succinylbenzoate--CoA ligase [Coleofasciculaceae cyanobacterium]|jgi:O-succinylbenzoic acid--CoA ligase